MKKDADEPGRAELVTGRRSVIIIRTGRNKTAATMEFALLDPDGCPVMISTLALHKD